MRGAYAAGKLDGPWTRYHPGGHVAERGAWRHGKRDGVWRELAADGTELGEYRMTRGTGVERHWWAPGRPRSETTWRDGVRNGEARTWNEAGVPILDEHWRNGVLHGDRRWGSRPS